MSKSLSSSLSDVGGTTEAVTLVGATIKFPEDLRAVCAKFLQIGGGHGPGDKKKIFEVYSVSWVGIGLNAYMMCLALSSWMHAPHREAQISEARITLPRLSRVHRIYQVYSHSLLYIP